MTLNDPNLQAAQDELDNQQQQITNDASQIASDAQQYATLQRQFAATRAQVRLDLQKNPNWHLMAGANANTGQTGSLGTGVFTPGDVATLTCVPAGPWYDAGYSLDMGEFPDHHAEMRYHNEWMLPTAADVAAAHQLEMDASPTTGTNRFHLAVAAHQQSGVWVVSYFDPCATKDATTGLCKSAWVPTTIPIPVTAGQFFSLESVGRLDYINNKTQYFGFYVNGTWYEFPKTCIAEAKSWAKNFKPILQLDSGGKGIAFTAQAQNTYIVWS